MCYFEEFRCKKCGPTDSIRLRTCEEGLASDLNDEPSCVIIGDRLPHMFTDVDDCAHCIRAARAENDALRSARHEKIVKDVNSQN